MVLGEPCGRATAIYGLRTTTSEAFLLSRCMEFTRNQTKFFLKSPHSTFELAFQNFHSPIVFFFV